MGTPDFARTILERLVADGHDVCGVFTQPDKPRNRNKVTPSPVKEYALSQNIPVFQPVTMRDGTALADFRALEPELAVVAAYGRILPQKVLDVPTLGCINIHASVLPKYRGSAPYQWAVLDGLKETGVTAMYLQREMDAGDIIDVSKTPIGENETAGELLDRLAVLGAALLSKTLTRFSQGPVEGIKQDESRPMPSAIGNPCSSNSRADMALPEVMHCPSTAVRTLSGTAARNDPVCSIGSPPFLPDGKRMCGQGAVGPAGHTVRRKCGLRETHRCTIGYPQR